MVVPIMVGSVKKGRQPYLTQLFDELQPLEVTLRPTNIINQFP